MRTFRESSSWIKSDLVSIICTGIAIHLLLLVAVFDTYFKSPLEHGMSLVKSTKNPPSKRLVLFVADGLRAQAIYEDGSIHAPYLNSIRRTRGAWGVSYTRVPTESRPGHVALLAGIYEDPSAIFKGWKHNPVEFDSVINQSKNAWCFGSPDIVPIFNKDERKHIHIFAYSPEMQDFGNKQTTLLDSWVFDKVEATLKKLNGSVEFEESGNLFFLHLLGLDTAGHAFKPTSKEYLNNLNFVDRNIERIETLFADYFKDGLTSFIFTSDHGMTDWGSHGSGLDHETFTPFIAWGSGVNFKHSKDLHQIDIAPLISALLGLNFPTNNLGMLPTSYFNISKSRKMEIFLKNLEQIFNIFNVKQARVKESTWFFKGYSKDFQKSFRELYDFNGSYDEFEQKSVQVFAEILKGIQYNHDYFMSFILFSISVGLIMWLLYLSSSLVEINEKTKKFKFLQNFVVSYIISVIVMCSLQGFSFLYYVYFIFPGIVSYFAFSNLNFPRRFSINLNGIFYIIYFVSNVVFFILGFEKRFCFSLMMISNAFSIFLNVSSEKLERYTKVSWVLSCLILALFPLLPLMFTKFHVILFVSGVITWNIFMNTIRGNRLFKFHKIMFNISGFVSLVISLEIFENSTFLKYISWFLFVIPLGTIPFSMKTPEVRTASVILAFGPFYVLTTMSYELIFSSCYCYLLLTWELIEEKINTCEKRKNFENFRKSLTFVSLILIGFFGTGNIASLNSFDPMWVRCFLTVFSPFKMTILIVLKLLIPLLYTACVFRCIVLKTGMNLKNSFCAILFISDIMVFYFMYKIKNVGSWLDIGVSLSHFVVVECLTIGIIILYSIATFLTNYEIKNYYPRNDLSNFH